MGIPYSTRLLVGILCLAVLSPPAATAADAQRRIGRDGGWRTDDSRDPYDAGYRAGIRRGEQDGRRGRGFDLDPGFNRRDDFRRGFADGYRAGYDRFRGRASRQGNFPDAFGRRAPGGYHEAAAARGYSDGYDDGLNDGRGGDRYDPVASRDYRDGDNGYSGSYGSREAYRNNYRAGFRQGYEEGYRDGTRRR
jgi:hypothetical protein